MSRAAGGISLRVFTFGCLVVESEAKEEPQPYLVGPVAVAL